jgi:hypothetical protein
LGLPARIVVASAAAAWLAGQLAAGQRPTAGFSQIPPPQAKDQLAGNSKRSTCQGRPSTSVAMCPL